MAATVNLGQSGDMAEIRAHALSAGAIRAHVLDKRQEFAREIVLPSLKAGALSDTRYPMATALSRPLIAKTLVEIAAIESTTVIAHGATGRDRRRLAQPITTLNPSLAEIACAEEIGFLWNLRGNLRRWVTRSGSTTTSGHAPSAVAATTARRPLMTRSSR